MHRIKARISLKTVIYSLHSRLCGVWPQMIEVRQTVEFNEWLDRLKDRRAVDRIAQRIVRSQSGLLGDVKPVGEGVSELRVDHGAGYRVYFVRRGAVPIVLLCGGDQRTQQRDIAKAQAMATELEI